MQVWTCVRGRPCVQVRLCVTLWMIFNATCNGAQGETGVLRVSFGARAMKQVISGLQMAQLVWHRGRWQCGSTGVYSAAGMAEVIGLWHAGCRAGTSGNPLRIRLWQRLMRCGSVVAKQ